MAVIGTGVWTTPAGRRARAAARATVWTIRIPARSALIPAVVAGPVAAGGTFLTREACVGIDVGRFPCPGGQKMQIEIEIAVG
jgi:hypothetical protein